MAGRARVSRCSLQRRPRRDGEEAYLGLGELRAPQVGSNWLYELSEPISLSKKLIGSHERGRAQKPEWHSARHWSALLRLGRSCDRERRTTRM